ncbi:MAG: hypothetical protein AAFP84_13975 [Actinomycetota bacterium]
MTDDVTTDRSDDRDDERRQQSATALVVLKAADPAARARVADQPPSIETLDALRPSDDTIVAATDALRRLGFEVGPFLGNSMAITGTVAHVEAVFGVRLEGGDGVYSVVGDGDELPLDALDATLAGRIERIVFEPPMELDEEPTWTP